MAHESSCSCGQLKFISENEPVRVSICHCFACQKRTGSVFGVQARFRLQGTRTEGKSSQWVRVPDVADDNEKITFHFCPSCGSTVFWYLSELPDMVVTGVGNFADSKFPQPRVEVFGSRKHHWVDLGTLPLERYDVVNQ